jgi:regulator of protease activity HflC (stomatin/prohibitin superfamily)
MAYYLNPVDSVPQNARAFRRFLRRHFPSLTIILLAGMLIAAFLFPFIVITVPSGMVGVLWKRFNAYDLYCWCFVGRGTIVDPRELRDEGLHVIWPWDKLFLYNLRLQSRTQVYNAISKDGVSVNAQINMRYQLLHNYVGVLHKFIGPNYLYSVVDPEIGSRAREVIAQYTAQEVYTSREQIQEKIRQEAQKSLATHLNSLVQPEAMEQPDPKHYNDFLQNSIQIIDTLVLSIELPPPIVAAINRQTQQFYEIQEYKYRVEREAQESTRKQIEANGIAAFQRTVSQGISDSYLRWRGIEATLALAQSPNSKIVVIGSGKDGLPIILGNVDSPPVVQPKPAESPTPGKSSAFPPVGDAPPALNAEGMDAAASAGKDGQPGSSAQLDLSRFKAILPYIPDWLNPVAGTPPQQNPTAGAPPSQNPAPGAPPAQSPTVGTAPAQSGPPRRQ